MNVTPELQTPSTVATATTIHRLIGLVYEADPSEPCEVEIAHEFKVLAEHFAAGKTAPVFDIRTTDLRPFTPISDGDHALRLTGRPGEVEFVKLTVTGEDHTVYRIPTA